MNVFRVHGIAVCDDANYFHEHCNDLLPKIGVSGVKSEDILDIIEGHKGKGYGISTQEELGKNTDIHILHVQLVQLVLYKYSDIHVRWLLFRRQCAKLFNVLFYFRLCIGSE